MQVEERSGKFFRGVVDNPLVETRLHGLNQGDEIVFHENDILALHDVHRQNIVAGMDVADLKELAQWVGELRRRE